MFLNVTVKGRFILMPLVCFNNGRDKFCVSCGAYNEAAFTLRRKMFFM